MIMLERLRDAMNAHDAERMVALFAQDYRSVQPAHPGRDFVGRDQVSTNWMAVFAGVPDFAAELTATSVDGPTEWGEWAWRGHHTDGEVFAMAGVMIIRVRDDQIAHARLFLEPVEAVPQNIDDAVDALYGSASTPTP